MPEGMPGLLPNTPDVTWKADSDGGLNVIFGECPYCDSAVANHLAEGVALPVVSRETCEDCGRDYWLRHSRLDPEALPIDDWSPGEPRRA